ncbi:MAG: HD-GYP domain-containing protein [Deltaproteobacteria bacterium]|nr:HD-GYP domain-containing protein [Deltaproteobacteria bacterium]
MNDTIVDNTIEKLFTMDYIYDSIEGMSGGNDDIFREVASLALQITGGGNCFLALLDEGSDSCHFRVVGDPSGRDYREAHTPPFDALFREVVQNKETILVGPDVEFSESVICAPLMIRGKIFGVLSLSGKRDGRTFTRDDLHYISTLAKRASLNMENKILYESVYSNIAVTFQSLVTSIQLRDHYTERHSVNVTGIAVKAAEALNCSEKEIESIRIAGMLHDIGKIAIPDKILLKEGRLTEEEYTIIKEHPTIGENILKAVALMDTERKIILHHHERWDGKGYPDGLSGKEIPLLSRILSVADSFDAMITNRPYREALTIDVAIDELKKNSSTQFDKDVVGTFISARCGSC